MRSRETQSHRKVMSYWYVLLSDIYIYITHFNDKCNIRHLKDFPEFLSSVLDKTEQCTHNNETNINDLQAQSVVLDRTVSLLSSIALTDIEQDRIEWESLAITFAEVMWAIENPLKTLAVKPSSISRRKNSQNGKSGRPQFYITSFTRSALQKVQPCQEEIWLSFSHPNFSEGGNNLRRFETEIYDFFSNYTRIAASGQRGSITLGHILQFVMGIDKEPSLGLGVAPCVEFGEATSHSTNLHRMPISTYCQHLCKYIVFTKTCKGCTAAKWGTTLQSSWLSLCRCISWKSVNLDSIKL